MVDFHSIADSIHIVDKYIRNRTWEGILQINGGYGPQSFMLDNVILKTPKVYIDIYTEPTIKSVDKVETKDALQALLSGPTVSRVDKKEGYSVGFKGIDWEEFLKVTEAIGYGTPECQIYLLKSIWDGTGLSPYELTINVKPTHSYFNIKQGKWVPDFDDAIPVVGW